MFGTDTFFDEPQGTGLELGALLLGHGPILLQLDRNDTQGASVGYTYLHSAIDGFTCLAYTEALEDEKAVTTIGFFCRARAFFAAHGITVDRVVTDNGNNYRAADFKAKVVSLGGRHHRIRPYTRAITGRSNATTG